MPLASTSPGARHPRRLCSQGRASLCFAVPCEHTHWTPISPALSVCRGIGSSGESGCPQPFAHPYGAALGSGRFMRGRMPPAPPSFGHHRPSNVQCITRGFRGGSLRWLGLRPALYPSLPPFPLQPRIHVPSHPASVAPFGFFRCARAGVSGTSPATRAPMAIAFRSPFWGYMFMCSLPAPVGRMRPWVRRAGPPRAPASVPYRRVRSRPSFGFACTRARPMAGCSRPAAACPSQRSGQGLVSRSTSTHRRVMVPSTLCSNPP